ncbi:MAG: tetratricopeptide repeat protein [Paludibacteraceae bacterium]|nr:tetratricopeptide repeat protein [Paludibacteraceae bacterium]
MLAKRGIYFFIGLLVIAFFSTCSTKNNTTLSRGYHSVTTRYNVYFNAKESYKKGVESIAKGHTDSYTEILPIFPISVHENAKLATSEMDICIEKCEKAIRNHSITRKPKRKPNKSQDKAYQSFINQTEFNPMVEKSWLLLGQAQFHKADFMAANATFTYIIRNFSYNEELVTNASIWLARGYAEIGWVYEAEDLLNKLNETSFTPSSNLLFVYAKADLLLKQQRAKEALPFLETALLNEKKTAKQARLSFIIGQIYEKEQRYELAYTAYNEVLRKNPPYEMAFNANLKKAQSYQGNEVEKMSKNLLKLTKNDRNNDFLDQIYTSLAKLYLRHGQTDKAIEYLQLSIESSTRNGVNKAEALLVLGQLYLEKELYVQAQPLFNEAVPIVPTTYKNYRALRTLSENLNELALNHNRVLLEDSLQALATLPEAERIQRIEQVIEAEKEAAKKMELKLEADAKKQEEKEKNTFSTLPSLSLGDIGDKSWYFYNPTLMGRGKIEFQRTWGNRTLEDNWRRKNKVTVVADNQAQEQIPSAGIDTSAIADTGLTPDSVAPPANNGIAFYMQQIPVSAAQKEISDKAIMESLSNLVYVYKEKVPNYRLAQETYNELLQRFPNSPSLMEASFYMYQLHKQQGNTVEAEQRKQFILQNYPTSTYAIFLQNPNGAETLLTLQQAEEKLYAETYQAFVSNNFNQVVANVAVAQRDFAFSKLIPKFVFLEALSTSKQAGKVAFKAKLEKLILDFPESEITPMAKDMIALMQQGQEPQAEVSHGSLLTERVTAVTVQEFAENIAKAGFVYEPTDNHLFVFVVKADESKRNALVFDIASYNFTRFLIKELDIVVKAIDEETYAIAISGLDNLAEAIWYQKALLADKGLTENLQNVDYKGFVISAYNYASVIDVASLDRYLEFYRANNLRITEQKMIQELQQKAGFVGVEEK